MENYVGWGVVNLRRRPRILGKFPDLALAWLRQHPGQLIELSQLLGHESLDTTAVYTRASAADLARGVEQTPFNLDG